MRILLVPASYPPAPGGAPMIAHRLACHLVGQGLEVQVITDHHPRSLPKSETLDAVAVTRTTFPEGVPAGLRIDRVLQGKRASVQLTRAIHSFQPEVVAIPFPERQTRPVLEALPDGVRLVLSFYGTEVQRAVEDPDGPLAQQIRLAISRADTLTTPSRFVLEQLGRITLEAQEKGHVVPTGIDIATYQAPGQRSQSPHLRSYLFAFGRLSHPKGFDTLIAALPEDEPLDLLIAGEGDQLPRLQRLVQNFGYEERVHFLGHLEPRQLARYARHATAIAIPSREEPFGLTLVEALATPAPVLASDVGGIPEIVASLPAELRGGEAGVWLVPPNVAGFREALDAVLQKPGAKDIRKQRARYVCENFSWETVLDQYLAHLRPS